MQNTGLKWGLIGGVITILVSLITYVISPDVYLTGEKWFSIIALLVVMYLAGKEEREKHGGYITFQEILRPIFLTYVIIAVVSTITQFLMFKVVDPGMVDTLKQMQMEGMEKMKNFLGDDAYEAAIEKMEKDGIGPSLKTSTLALAISIVFGFGLSALYAVIMRKKNPELV